MKKSTLLVLGIWLLAALNLNLDARGRYTYRDYRVDRGIRGYYRPSSHRAQHSILREIRQNDRRISILERRLHRYGGGVVLGLLGGMHEARRIRETRWEINRLQSRNRYLYSLLYRGW